jgi:hypothetical protein
LKTLVKVMLSVIMAIILSLGNDPFTKVEFFTLMGVMYIIIDLVEKEK